MINSEEHAITVRLFLASFNGTFSTAKVM